MTGPDPGLDLTALRAIRGGTRDHSQILARIRDHLDQNGGFVAWSGGKDSTAVVDLALRVDPDVPVVFYDSGLEFPETLTYIREFTDTRSVNLTIIKAVPDLLTALIAAGDFSRNAPTRQLGFDLRDTLITVPAARAHALFGPGSLWGVRSAESRGRRALHRTQLRTEATRHATVVGSPAEQRIADRWGGVVRRQDKTVSFSPIWNWQTPQVWEYFADQGLPANPVYAKLAALGADDNAARVDAIIDPGHLDRGQITRLQRGWPDLYDRLVTVLPRLTDYS